MEELSKSLSFVLLHLCWTTQEQEHGVFCRLQDTERTPASMRGYWMFLSDWLCSSCFPSDVLLLLAPLRGQVNATNRPKLLVAHLNELLR